MKKLKLSLLTLGAWGLLLAALTPVAGATINVILATDQTPGDAGVARVASVTGGIWDRGGRVWMPGLYRPDAPSIVERNALWVWTAPTGSGEVYSDDDSVPYYVGGVAGDPIPMSVPRL